TKLVDMNGDGLPDYVSSSKGYNPGSVAGLWVLTNNGHGFNAPVNWNSATLLGNDYAWPHAPTTDGTTAYRTDLVDMNGDGRPDYVADQNGAGVKGLWVLINNGAGFNTPQNWNSSGLLGTNNAAYPQLGIAQDFTKLIDMNGDGLPDYVAHKNGAGTLGMWVLL